MAISRNDLACPNGLRYELVRARAALSGREQQLLAIDSTAGAVAVTIPAPGQRGRWIAIGDDGGAAAANPITIQASGGGAVIDNAVSYVLGTNNAVVHFVDDGTQWRRALLPRLIQDVAGRFFLAFEVAAMLAGGGSVPTGTGFRHVTAGVEDAAATANMSYSGGGLVFNDAGFATFGATSPASAGTVRFRAAFSARARNAANTDDLSFAEFDGANNLYLGTDLAFTASKQPTTTRLFASSNVYLGVGASTHLQLSSAGVQIYQDAAPLIVGFTNPAAAGDVRLRNARNVRARNAGNTEDVQILTVDASDRVVLGENVANRTVLFMGNDCSLICNSGEIGVTTFGAQPINLNAGATGEARLRVNGSSKLIAGLSNLRAAVPLLGESSTHGLSGRATQAMADANQTLGASVYSRKIVRTSGALTAVRTATVPHPASEDESYFFIWENRCTGANVTMSTGSGTTVSTAPNTITLLHVTPDGISFA